MIDGNAVVSTGAVVDTAGGNTAAAGRLLYGANTTAPYGGTFNSILTATSLFNGTGPTANNPYTRSLTPMVPGLVGGAEAFGLTTLSSTDFSAVAANAPAGAAAAMLLTHVGPGNYGNDFKGFDVLFFINLGTQPLTSPVLGSGSATARFPLLQGGFAHDATFGGDGIDAQITLLPHQVYATLVPVGTTAANFDFVLNGARQGKATTSLTRGIAVYSNASPTTAAGGPYSVAPGGGVSLQGGASDPDGDSLAATWTINGHASAAAGFNPTLSAAQLQALGVVGGATALSYPVRLVVDDGHGHTATSSTSVVYAALVPPVPPASPFAVGADAGGGPVVKRMNPDGTPAGAITPFESGFTGGVRVATADVTGDGVADLIAGSGPGRTAEVRVFDGRTGQTVAAVTPFADFTGGVFAAAGDLTGDGLADLVVTPDQSGGPRVVVLRGGDFAPVASFFAIDDVNFRGGVRPAVGDLNHDGAPDLVVSAGFGGGPRIAGFDGKTVTAADRVKLFNDFFVFETALRNGAYVAVGDVNGDGYGDLVAGAGPGGGPRVLALSGADLVAGRGSQAGVLTNFFAGNAANRGGVRVATGDLDRDARADLVTGPGAGGGSRVSAYLGKEFAGAGVPEWFGVEAFPGFTGGVFVG